MNEISVKALAGELGCTVGEVALQVSALCMAWSPAEVVVSAAGSFGASLLHETAADEIRTHFAQTVGVA